MKRSNDFRPLVFVIDFINMGSVGQRATKLLAIKVGVLKKKSASSAIPAKLCAIAFGRVRIRPGWNHFQSLMAINFTAL